MKRLITANEKIEELVKMYNGTTIQDTLYGPMNSLDEIKQEFSKLNVIINSTENSEDTEIIKLPDGWLTVDIDKRKHSTWIYIDTYDEDDCPLEEEDENSYFEEDEDEDEE